MKVTADTKRRKMMIWKHRPLRLQAVKKISNGQKSGVHRQ